MKEQNPQKNQTILPYDLGGRDDPCFQDHGGNIIPDRIEANNDYYDWKPAPDEARDDYINDQSSFVDGEDSTGDWADHETESERNQ